MVKDGAAIVSENVVVAVSDPDVPVTVTGYVPSTAALVADRVSVVEEVVGLVLNAAVTPLGSPLTERVTLPLNPFAALR